MSHLASWKKDGSILGGSESNMWVVLKYQVVVLLMTVRLTSETEEINASGNT